MEKGIQLRSPTPIMAGSWFVEFYMSEVILGITSDCRDCRRLKRLLPGKIGKST